ncbi:MAG: response regulator transcription factor [Bacteroidota bacterium]|nr:response regulator transcription factor [Bacteroidota bacterium]
MQNHILLVEDDPNFGEVLKDYLELNSFKVTLARDGEEGLDRFRKGFYDLCILDVMMPKKDGFTLASEIREENKHQPMIFLTAKSMKNDMLEGFRLGADDYLTKPFDAEVLLYKIKAVLNRGSRPVVDAEDSQLIIGKYRYDTSLRELYLGDQLVRKLSPKEGDLLKLMAQYRNQLMPRGLALEKIWGEDNYFTGRSMDVYVAKLRKYLKDDPNVEIVNIHSEGFRLLIRE